MAALCFHEIAVLYAQSFSSVQLCNPMDCRLLCLWNSPGKNTGVGCHVLLQGIFLTQGSNPSLLHWQVLNAFHVVNFQSARKHRSSSIHCPCTYTHPQHTHTSTQRERADMPKYQLDMGESVELTGYC